MTSRFIIGPFRAQGINLSGSDFVAGLPSPSAALGFVGALARGLGVTGWQHRAILVIHDLEEHEGRARGEQNLKSGRITPLDFAESLTGRGLFTIIAEIPGSHSLSDVTSKVMRMRFSGGAIFAPLGKSLPQVIRAVPGLDLANEVARLPRGMVLAPPHGRASAALVSFGEATSLEAIAMRAYDRTQMGEGGYIVPIPVGYRVHRETLQPVPPKQCRDDTTPYALVDSAVGLAEFISIRNRETFEDVESAFTRCGWSWATRGDFRMFSEFHLGAVRQN